MLGHKVRNFKQHIAISLEVLVPGTTSIARSINASI